MDDSETKKLYKNVLDNDWKALKKNLLPNDVELLLRPISVHCDSILHLVVHSGTEEPLKWILNLLPGHTLPVNIYGNTVLHEAAISGNLEAVKLLVENNDQEILVKENDSEETPLFKAAAFGKTKIVTFLASCEGQTVDSSDGTTKQLKDIHRKNKNGDTVLFAAVQGQHFGTALELLKIDKNLTDLEDGNQTSFNLLAQIPSAFKTRYEISTWKKLVFFCLPVGCDHNDYGDEIESKYKDIKSCLHRKGSNLDGEENKDQDIESGLHRKGLPVSCDDNEENKDQDIESGLPPKVGSDRTTEMEESDIKCGLIRLCHTFLAVLYNIYLSIWTRIIRVSPLAKKIWKEKRDHAFAWELARKLIDKYSSEYLKRFGNQVFTAIKSRNVEAATLALDNYPQQLEELNRKIVNSVTAEKERERGNLLLDAIRTENVEFVKLTLKKNLRDLDCSSFWIQKIMDQDANPLFVAIRAGNVEVVKLILEEYPQALEQINNKNQNILHVAAMYRQKEIFNLVKTKEIPMIRLARQIDDDGYTILHSVADTQHYKGGTRSGPAYKLQEELKWFDSVKEIMPSSYIMLRDKNNKTALEIFKVKHDEQLKKAQSWIKGTSQSCSGVAVLVATVVFAAAFTVPGGFDDNNGFPILLHSPLFISFTALDVLSLSCSLTSVVMFLSILTSPFELENFRASLPRKLTFGFMLLFISVAATMLTFTSTIVLIIRLGKDRKFTMILLCSTAFCPVFMLALTHFSLIFSFIKEWVSLVISKFPPCPGFSGSLVIPKFPPYPGFFGNRCIKI